MNLLEYGWSNFWMQHTEQMENIARITRVEKDRYYLISNNGEVEGKLSGNFRTELDVKGNSLCVGDWIVFQKKHVTSSGTEGVQIYQLLERKSYFARPHAGNTHSMQLLAANIDYAFLLSSANNDLSVNRLRRYVVLCEEGGITPVIVISKIDLTNAETELQKQIRTAFPRYHVLSLSTKTGEGIDEIKKYLCQGMTGIFLGSSGVGKSTLSNALLGKEEQLIQNIREDDSKGRHTTTQRSLFLIPESGLIIDTPGLREVGVAGSTEHTEAQFTEIKKLLTQCQFGNCQHTSEPGCAIQTALQDNTLNEEDWNEYNKLLREQEYVNSKLSKAKKSNSKEKWKKIHKKMRSRKKFEKKNGMKGW